MARVSELPIVERINENPCEAQSRNDSKLPKQFASFFHSFNIDAVQWDARKIVTWTLWKIILFVIVLGLGSFTVKTSWPLLLDYAESPTSYIPKTLFNDSIALPPFIIHLPLLPKELDDYWKSSEDLSSSENAKHYQKLLAAYFDNKTITKETLLAKESQWSNYLLYIGYYYLSFFNDFENLLLNETQTKVAINTLNNSDNDLASALTFLEEEMIRLNISLIEFEQKYGTTIKSLFNLTFTTSKQEHSKILEADNNYCWVDSKSSGIYFHFQHFIHPIKDGEIITIQATKSRLPNYRPNYDYQNTMDIYIGGRPYYGIYDAQIYSAFNSRIMVVPLQVASAYRSLPYHGGKQQCYENKSIESCKSECRMDYYRKKCGCLPAFGHTDLPFTGSECYLKHYKTCFNEENMFNTDDKSYSDLANCEEGCLDSCERITYVNPPRSMYFYHKIEDIYTKTKYSIIELTIAKFDYPIFEETPKWTFPSFFGVLGGSLGLWLGINVLDYTIYAATATLFLIQRCERKAIDETDTKSVSFISRNDGRRSAWEDNTSSVWKRKAMTIENFIAFWNKIGTWKNFKNFAGISFRLLLGISSLIITILALKEYFSEKTMATLDIKYNDSIALPNATICLPLQFGELDEFNFNRRNFAYALSEYINRQNMIKENFAPEKERWDNTVRNVVHAYLIEISNCEVDDYALCNRIFENDTELVSAINLLETVISKLNISIDELRQKFGKEVAALYSFNVSLWDFGTWVEDMNISRTKYVGEKRICYEIPFNLYPLGIISNYQVNISEYTLPSPIAHGYDRSKITFDFENSFSMIAFTRKPIFVAYFGEIFGLTVELSEYHSRREGNDGEARCSKLTFDQCETVGLIKFIQNQCNCSPTSWPNLLNYINNNVSNVCNMKVYSSCLNSTELWNKEEYVRQCLKPCERFSLKTKNVWIIGNSDKTEIIINMENMNMLIFNEELTWNFEKLLEIIGGIVGFFLGYSLYNILCFAFLPIAGLFAFILKIAKTVVHKNSQINDIEGKPAPNILTDSIEPRAENLDDSRRFMSIMHKLKKLGWKGDLLWTVEYIFKLIVIICFGCLTVKMCTPIFRKYKEGETVSIVNFVANKSLSLEPATVCMGVYAEELDDHWMKLPNTEFEARIENYFNQSNITKENFLGRMKWSNTLRFIIHYYLFILTDIEKLYRQEHYNLTAPSETDSSLPHFFKGWGKDLYSAVILLEKNINYLNISVNELRQSLGLKMAAILSLYAYQTPYCQAIASCSNATKISIGEVTAIYHEKICYQIRLDRYPFQSYGQRLVVTANSNSLSNKLLDDNKRILQLFLLAKNDSGENTPIMDNKYLLTTSFPYTTRYSIAISAVYQSLEALNRCSKYKTRENCYAECRVALFLQMCNCTPTTWSNWISSENYEECKLSDYSLCVDYYGNDDVPCVKENCGAQAELCERLIFDAQMIANVPSSTGARIEAFTASFEYPIFKERYELPFEEFIGALGGAIGFYLGLDFLKVFHIIRRAIVFLVTLFRAMKKT